MRAGPILSTSVRSGWGRHHPLKRPIARAGATRTSGCSTGTCPGDGSEFVGNPTVKVPYSVRRVKRKFELLRTHHQCAVLEDVSSYQHPLPAEPLR